MQAGRLERLRAEQHGDSRRLRTALRAPVGQGVARRQRAAGRVQGDLPVAAPVGQPRHPRPAVFQALHRRTAAPGLLLPLVEQAERFRPAQAAAAERRLAAASLDQELRLQHLLAAASFQQQAVAALVAVHFAHPRLEQRHAGGAQVLAQRGVEARAVEEEFLVERALAAVPQHPPRRGQVGTGQRVLQAGLAQAV
ncbi:hypothetical protein D9M71_493010 [compost metagenome]